MPFSNTQYRPLDDKLTQQYNEEQQHHHHQQQFYENSRNMYRSNSKLLKSKTTRRKLLPLGLFVCLLLFYVMWSGLAATTTTQTKADLSYTDNLQSTSFINESLVVCGEEMTDKRLFIKNQPREDFKDLRTIYFVTPTYPRREQFPELIRLAYTLLHVPRLHWIVANDYSACNAYLDNLLSNFGVPYTHLSSPMPQNYRKLIPIPRGVSNRRAALHWLRYNNITEGILYFGDDDNTYDIKLFEEIRLTKRVSMFPVGLIELYAVSGPVVRNGKVVGFLDSWVADRHWPVDMAGFAVNLHYMADYPNATMLYEAGYEEDFFLRSIGLKINDIEPRGKNCTQIMVWHTQTKSHRSPVVKISNEYLDERSNLGALFKALEQMGVASTSENSGKRAIISRNGKIKSLSFYLS